MSIFLKEIKNTVIPTLCPHIHLEKVLALILVKEQILCKGDIYADKHTGIPRNHGSEIT